LPRPTPPRAATSGKQTRRKPFRVLLVDDEPQLATLVQRSFGDEALVEQASSVQDAQRRLADTPADLLLIDGQLPDGSGLALAEQVKRDRGMTRTIVLSAQKHVDLAIQAMRAGAEDFITKPLNEIELARSLRAARQRHAREQERQRRLRRLRRLCRKLDVARREITQQVDVLCTDLVNAYQELATQMQHVVQANEFTVLIRDELDLEAMIRKTLEYLLQKAGPTNAAIFLPSTADEFSLGGYVNLDCSKDSADVLLQHLADVVASKLAQRELPVHITDNSTLKQWIGNDASYLEDSHLIGFSCRHESETLAVIILFRDQATPFATTLVDVCTAVGPILGDYLAKVIRIHHRHLPNGPGKSST
jgi:DNA-binding response OmpR family regulator